MKIIDVVTGTRAEFGLLLPVIRKLGDEPGIQPRLIVTGSHLMPELGETVDEIEQAGTIIHARLDIRPEENEPWLSGCLTNAIRLFSQEFRDHPPDLVLLLGDRYEIFGAATAAAINDIPIAHIAGGETTEGAKDEYFRHCITKMATLHFTATEEYRRRVIQLGEHPERVFNTGALGVENIRNMKPVNRQTLCRQTGLDASRPFLLCTVHPETLGGAEPLAVADALCGAIEQLGMDCLFTGANSDEGGREINDAVQLFCSQSRGAVFHMNLGLERYLSAMRLCAAVCGNSSSAITESAALGVAAVNIGDRQRGRLMAENVLNCTADTDSVRQAIERATSPGFADRLRRLENPFGRGNTSELICLILRQTLASPVTLRKTFYDIHFEVPS